MGPEGDHRIKYRGKKTEGEYGSKFGGKNILIKS
jgi:hypothetical protein